MLAVFSGQVAGSVNQLLEDEPQLRSGVGDELISSWVCQVGHELCLELLGACAPQESQASELQFGGVSRALIFCDLVAEALDGVANNKLFHQGCAAQGSHVWPLLLPGGSHAESLLEIVNADVAGVWLCGSHLFSWGDQLKLVSELRNVHSVEGELVFYPLVLIMA